MEGKEGEKTNVRREGKEGCYGRSVHPSSSTCGSGSAAAEGVGSN